MNLWPPSIGSFVIPSVYKRWPGQARCGSQPAWEGDTLRYPSRRRVSTRAGKSPEAAPERGKVCRVEYPQGGGKTHLDRRRGTDRQTC